MVHENWDPPFLRKEGLHALYAKDVNTCINVLLTVSIFIGRGNTANSHWYRIVHDVIFTLRFTQAEVTSCTHHPFGGNGKKWQDSTIRETELQNPVKFSPKQWWISVLIVLDLVFAWQRELSRPLLVLSASAAGQITQTLALIILAIILNHHPIIVNPSVTSVKTSN